MTVTMAEPPRLHHSALLAKTHFFNSPFTGYEKMLPGLLWRQHRSISCSESMEFPLGSLSLGAGEASMVNGSTVRLAGSCQGVTRHQHQAPAPDTKELSGGHQEAAGTKSQRVTRHKEAGGRQLGNTKNLSWGSPYAHPAVPAPIMGGHKMPPKIVKCKV